MTAIALLEKLGADASFDPSMLSEEDKNTLKEIISRASTFNAINFITTPDEEERESDEDDEESEDTK